MIGPESKFLKINDKGISEEISQNNFSIYSIYTYEKLIVCLRTLMLSFIDLLFNYNNLIKKAITVYFKT